MDITTFLLGRIFEDRENAILIFRLYVGYGFHGAEFTAAALTYGFAYTTVVWMYIFYGYIGLLVIASVIFTILLATDKSNSVEITILFFKITSIINAAFVFFQLYLQQQRDPFLYVLLAVTGKDIGLDFLEFALNCAFLAKDNKVSVYY